MFVLAEGTVAQFGEPLAVSIESDLKQAQAKAHYEQQVAYDCHEGMLNDYERVELAD
jgi:hypothetical protein